MGLVKGRRLCLQCGKVWLGGGAQSYTKQEGNCGRERYRPCLTQLLLSQLRTGRVHIPVGRGCWLPEGSRERRRNPV